MPRCSAVAASARREERGEGERGRPREAERRTREGEVKAGGGRETEIQRQQNKDPKNQGREKGKEPGPQAQRAMDKRPGERGRSRPPGSRGKNPEADRVPNLGMGGGAGGSRVRLLSSGFWEARTGPESPALLQWVWWDLEEGVLGGGAGDSGGAFTWPCARNLYSQHASTTWEPEGSRCAAESLGLILCTIKHSAASPSCSYTSSTLNKHNDDIRCNSR